MRPKGLTLSELLLAAAILAFALSGLLLLFTNCILLNAAGRSLSIATAHAQYVMEDIKTAGFTGLEARINDNNGTPAGWDLSAAQVQALYNLTPLDSEAVSTAVFQSGDPLGVSVAVNWKDRGSKNRSTQLQTYITNY